MTDKITILRRALRRCIKRLPKDDPAAIEAREALAQSAKQKRGPKPKIDREKAAALIAAHGATRAAEMLGCSRRALYAASPAE